MLLDTAVPQLATGKPQGRVSYSENIHSLTVKSFAAGAAP